MDAQTPALALNQQETSPPILIDSRIREQVLGIVAGSPLISWRLDKRWWQSDYRLTITGPAWKVAEVSARVQAAIDALWWELQW
jgi:hypothetical protein